MNISSPIPTLYIRAPLAVSLERAEIRRREVLQLCEAYLVRLPQSSRTRTPLPGVPVLLESDSLPAINGHWIGREQHVEPGQSIVVLQCMQMSNCPTLYLSLSEIETTGKEALSLLDALRVAICAHAKQKWQERKMYF